MSTARRLHHTYAEYLDIERQTDVRHEYLDGEIYAMAGGTPVHAFLATRLTALLASQLPEGCRIGSSDLKVRIDATGLTTYPDLSIICGPPQLSAIDENAVTNPVALIEVTSPSTEEYDRGEKLRHYQRLPSVECVVIVSHARRALTLVTRAAGAWVETEVTAGGRVTLPQPPCGISVDELYSVVDGLPNAPA